MNNPPVVAYPHAHLRGDAEIAIVSEGHDSSEDEEISYFDPLDTNQYKRDNAKKEDDSDDQPPFFSHTMDDEDEAWVYQHMRGGSIEPIHIMSQNQYKKARPNPDDTSFESTMKRLEDQSSIKLKNPKKKSKSTKCKPRHSDAILSCPYCFNTVCMDCQQHEKHQDQFRAMFVMNIVVRWESPLIYDSKSQGLVHMAESNNEKVVIPSKAPKVYYPVLCHHCSTQVAVLDMEEEIYHFSGCVAST